MGRRRQKSDVDWSARKDISREAIEDLRKRITAGAATFLIKVIRKAHRGEPANEKADIQADKAISSTDVPMG